MRTLLLTLRSSRLWLLSLVLSLVAAVVMLRLPSYQVGNWLKAGGTGAAMAFFLGPLAAAMAAWVSSIPERVGLDEQLAASSRSLRHIDGLGLGAVLSVTLTPYLVGNAVGFARTATTFPPGFDWWVRYVVLGAATIVLSVALGWLLGRTFPPIYSAVAAAVVTLVWQMYAPTESGILTAGAEPWEGPTLGGLAFRCALSFGLVVVLVCVAWQREGLERRAPAMLAALVVLVGALLYGAQQSKVIALRAIPDEPTCVDGETTVCLWPEDERLVPMVETFAPRLQALPPPLIPPDVVYQYGLRRMVTVIAGETYTEPTGLDISETNPWSYASGMAEQIEGSIVESCLPADPEGFIALERVIKWIEYRLMDSTDPDYSVTGAPPDAQAAWDDAVRVTATLSDSDQLEWVDQQLTIALGTDCTLLAT